MRNTDKPLLGEQGEKDAQRFLDDFKERMKKIVDETLGNAYVDCMPWIEADSWQNMRNHMVYWIEGYRELRSYDAKRVREAILKNHREEIINDLNQDNLNRIAELEKRIEEIREMYRGT